MPLPAGTEGIVWLKAPDRARFHYHGDDDKTRSVYRRAYFTLGDVGYMDAEGWLFLTDRSAHLIISGGVNVYPAEVDHVLLEHPAVGDVATIGVPDDEWGEPVLGVIEPQRGTQPSPGLCEELLEFCRSRLARYKCPRSIEFVAELPRSASGKVPKAALRERYRGRQRPRP